MNNHTLTYSQIEVYKDGENPLSSRKKQRTKLLFVSVLLFNTFGFFSKGATGSSIILTYALPLSFFIGDFLYEIKQKKIVNTILTLILLCLAVIFAGQMGAI